MTIFVAHRSLRVLACLLIAGLELTRVAHGPHQSRIASNHPIDSSQSTKASAPNEQPPLSPPSHDPDQCQICHFIATSSAAIAAARPAVVIAAPPVDLRISPVVAEPHSADVDLPCAARAPPITFHAS